MPVTRKSPLTLITLLTAFLFLPNCETANAQEQLRDALRGAENARENLLNQTISGYRKRIIELGEDLRSRERKVFEKFKNSLSSKEQKILTGPVATRTADIELHKALIQKLKTAMVPFNSKYDQVTDAGAELRAGKLPKAEVVVVSDQGEVVRGRMEFQGEIPVEICAWRKAPLSDGSRPLAVWVYGCMRYFSAVGKVSEDEMANYIIVARKENYLAWLGSVAYVQGRDPIFSEPNDLDQFRQYVLQGVLADSRATQPITEESQLPARYEEKTPLPLEKGSPSPGPGKPDSSGLPAVRGEAAN